jgi:uncharacterized protein (DUF433 family)
VGQRVATARRFWVGAASRGVFQWVSANGYTMGPIIGRLTADTVRGGGRIRGFGRTVLPSARRTRHRQRLSDVADCRTGDRTMPRLLDRIAIDPQISGGKPCIKGTRIWVSLVLDFLADGMSESELLTEYPQLTHEDVLAALSYGAEMTRERIVPVPPAKSA